MAKEYGLGKMLGGILLTIGFMLSVSAPLVTLALPAVLPPAQDSEKPAPSQPSPPAQPLTMLPPAAADASAPEYDSYTYQERREQNLPTALPPAERYYGQRTVYLTFDDGPDGENTPLILDILKGSNIKATFFVLGTEAEKHPGLLQRIYNEGHAIGNHSYNHVYRELYQSVFTYTGQLQRTDTVIKNIVGVRPHISRAPGGSAGSFTKEYWETLKQQGYIEVGWNISSGDASSAKAPAISGNVISQAEQNHSLWSHAIVLMHDGRGHMETVRALPQIIKYFKDRDFEFRVINSKTPPAW